MQAVSHNKIYRKAFFFNNKEHIQKKKKKSTFQNSFSHVGLSAEPRLMRASFSPGENSVFSTSPLPYNSPLHTIYQPCYVLYEWITLQASGNDYRNTILSTFPLS